MDSISSALYQAVYKAVIQNFRSFYKGGYITAFDKSTDAGGGFYTYLAILRKKGLERNQRNGRHMLQCNSQNMKQRIHKLKECGILSKTGAPVYWLCELSQLCTCAIVCSNPRCIDQTHYTPPPPLEHRRRKPAVILFGE